MINLRTLETFYWVAHLGGFHRAAEKLNTTQPAISARVAQLEEGFSARLFERDKHGCHLTAKGRALMDYAERMLALKSEMVVAMTAPSEMRGSVKLGVSETIVHTWLSDLLRQVHEQYPAITIDIVVDISSQLGAGLVDGSIDVALLLGPVSAANASNLPLCEYALSWAAAADCPLGRGSAPATLKDLAAWPIITYARNTKPFQQINLLFERSGCYGVRMFANTSLASIIRMTLDGIGICALPRHVISEQIGRGELRILETESMPMPSLSYTASYIERPDAPLNAIIAAAAQRIAAEWEGL